MKKVICALLALLLVGCQSTTTAQPVETAEVSAATKEATEIVQALGISDTMQTIKNRNIRGMFFSGDTIYSDACVYMSTDEDSDTVGVFYVTDFELGLEDIETYVNDLSTKSNLYNSTELFKISNAVLVNNGTDKIVLIIASDIEQAKKLADKVIS